VEVVKDEQGNIEKTVVHEAADYVMLTDPPRDSALEMSQPGYGLFRYK
jgi:hypothetical protein